METGEMSVQALAEMIRMNQPVFVLDVRTLEEYQAINIGAVLIPLSELPTRMDELPKDRLIAVHCRSGHRSQTAQAMLLQAGFKDVKNVTGGILAWEQEYSISN